MKNLRRFHLPCAAFSTILVFSLACSITGGAATAGKASGGSPIPELPTDNRPAMTPALTGPVAVGEPFLICDTAVTIAGWTAVAPGEYFKPKSGNRFIAVDIVLVNLGKKSEETSWFTFELRDAYDEPIDEGLFPMTLAHGMVFRGGIAPGERARGMIGSEVPVAEQEFSLAAKCRNMESGQAGEMVVELGAQPLAKPAPSRFTGETVTDPFLPGRTATVHGADFSLKAVRPFPESALDPDSDPRVSAPPDWLKYAILELALVNNGTEVVQLSTVTDLYVKDPAGWRYPVISWANQVLDDPVVDVEVKPGKKTSGQVVVEVPVDAGHLFFVFENGYGSAAERAVFLMA